MFFYKNISLITILGVFFYIFAAMFYIGVLKTVNFEV